MVGQKMNKIKKFFKIKKAQAMKKPVCLLKILDGGLRRERLYF